MGHRLGRCSAPKRRKTRGTTRDDDGRVQNFTRLLFPSPLWMRARVTDTTLRLLSPRPGEMITTPNRLRGERRSTRVARVDKEVADGAKGVLKLAAKRPGPRFSRVSFLCPIFLKSRHEEGEQLALRQSVSCASLTLSSSLPPIAPLPLCLSLPSFAIPPRHALSLSLLLCFCNLFVSASSAFLFSPPSPPSFLCETVLVRARVVGLLPNLPRTHTAACRCISLAGERWAP